MWVELDDIVRHGGDQVCFECCSVCVDNIAVRENDGWV